MGCRRTVNWQRQFVVMCGGVLIAVLPVTARNLVVGKDLVWIASNGGVNFYIGNNPDADGVTAVVPGTRPDWWGGFEDSRRLAEEAHGYALKPSQVSHYWYLRGVRFIVSDPVRAAKLYARKCALLLGNGEISNERQLYFRRDSSSVLSRVRIPFAFIFAASVVGLMTLCTRQPRRRAGPELAVTYVLAAASALCVVAFFVTSRYRLTFVEFMLPGAAVGLVAVVDEIRRKRWIPGMRLVAVFALCFGLSLWNPHNVGGVAESRGQYGLGLDHFRERDLDAALIAFSRAIAADATFAPAWKMRGWVNERLGNLPAAISDLDRACSLDSTMSDAYFRLGVSYQKAGSDDRAEVAYVRAVGIDSTNVEAFTNLADICMGQGRDEEALPYLLRAIKQDSSFVNAIFGIGLYCERNGRPADARRFYERAIAYPPARDRLRRLREETR
jgi:Flp pilus assembly protein TadD